MNTRELYLKRKAEDDEQRRFLEELEAVNANGDSYEYLVAVRRSPAVPLTTKVRVARELLQYERPKLGITTQINLQGDFAAMLDRAIARSEGKKVRSEGSPGALIEHDASEQQGPMLPLPSTRLRRL
jgi:hypothetical protein